MGRFTPFTEFERSLLWNGLGDGMPTAKFLDGEITDDPLNPNYKIHEKYSNKLMDEIQSVENSDLTPIDLCEKALWSMINCSMIKQDKETPYKHGFRKGHDQRKVIDIHLMEKVIEELKKDGT